MNPLNYHPSEIAKAIVGAVLAALTALGTAVMDEKVTTGEWVGVAIAFVATFGAVFGVQNTAPAGRRRNNAGHADASLFLGIACMALLIVIIVKVA